MMSRELTSDFDVCSCDHPHVAVMHLSKFGGNIFIQFYYGDISFYEIQYGRHLPFWICWGKLWDHLYEGPFTVPIPCKTFVMIGLVVLKLVYLNFLLFTLESHIHGTKISVFFVVWLLTFKETSFVPPKRLILARNGAFWSFGGPDVYKHFP